jgi:hypothetical protein
MSNVPDCTTFATIYAGKAPWDIGKPQAPFVAAAARVTGPVLDAGCGAGLQLLESRLQAQHVSVNCPSGSLQLICYQPRAPAGGPAARSLALAASQFSCNELLAQRPRKRSRAGAPTDKCRACRTRRRRW